MQFKIGDKVRITSWRDFNIHRDEKEAGVVGVISGFRDKGYHGRYAVDTHNEAGVWRATYFCRVEEILPIDAAAIPFDAPMNLPRDPWSWRGARRWQVLDTRKRAKRK